MTENKINTTLKTIKAQQTVGGYDITGDITGGMNSITFSFTKKPNWFHRTCCRLFLGWKWKDKKEEKKSGLLLG